MNRRIKFSFVYSALAVFAILVSSCGDGGKSSGNQSEVESEITTLNGEAQGTTYSVSYWGTDKDYKSEIDSILLEFDKGMSTYREGSLINQINDFTRTDTVFAFYDSTKFMSVVFEVAREIWRKTDGAFDPSVYPLVQAYGFGLENRQEMTQEKVDSIMEFTGFTPSHIEMIEVEKEHLYKVTWIRKGVPTTKIDFNAIAQGYSVDVIADYLFMDGIENFMVEIGGEVTCRGIKPDSSLWRIGIDKPIENAEKRELEAIVELHNTSIATSGSYRKFYEKDGIKYSHTIDPKTGWPVQHSLLSATVMTPSCMTADAYATAFMVMGVEKTKDFLRANPGLDLEVFLIYDQDGNWETFASKGMEKVIQKIE
ncbi:FAD:protein FMN transferase [Halocola ammonii]